jgi:hypothetical protein
MRLRLALIWTDGRYRGKVVEWCRQLRHLSLPIVSLPLSSRVLLSYPDGGWWNALSPG